MNISPYLISHINDAVKDCIATCGYNYTSGGQSEFRYGQIINTAVNDTVVTVTCVINVDTEGTITSVELRDANEYTLVQTDATSLDVDNLTSGVVVFTLDMWQYIKDDTEDYYNRAEVANGE